MRCGVFVDGWWWLWVVVHEMRGFCGWVGVFVGGCPWNVGFSWMGGGVWGWLSMECGVFMDGWGVKGEGNEKCPPGAGLVDILYMELSGGRLRTVSFC